MSADYDEIMKDALEAAEKFSLKKKHSMEDYLEGLKFMKMELDERINQVTEEIG